jgi:hypothetical protein
MERDAHANKRGPKWNSLEIAEQVEEARSLLVQGWRQTRVRQLLAEKHGLSGRTADRRVEDARRAMVRDLDMIDRKEKAAQLLEAAEEILFMARESRQLSNALGALSFQARMLGLEAPRN